MKANKLGNDSKRLKRPRIHRATVPGESEKVNIVYTIKSTPEKGKTIKIDKKLVTEGHRL